MPEEMQRSMGRLESKVDLLLERSGNFDVRLASVEKKVWWASGASAIIAFFASHFVGKP